nr:nuclear transport factor 2 family protein [Gordonia jinghuaiqii]
MTRVYDAINTAVHNRDGAAFADLYTPNGSLMTPDGAIIAGTDALRDAFERWTEAGWVDQHAELVELTIDDRIVVEEGRSVGTFRVDGAETVARNNYIVVHVRSDDGRWLMLRDIWNTVSEDTPTGSY